MSFLTTPTAKITALPFVEKMKPGAVATMTVRPSGELSMGKMLWGKGTRMTLTYSVDGVIFALVSGATLGWLWPR